jgi:hypothetical protein
MGACAVVRRVAGILQLQKGRKNCSGGYCKLQLFLFYPLLLVRNRSFTPAAYQQRLLLIEAGLPTKANSILFDFVMLCKGDPAIAKRLIYPNSS